MNAAMNGNDRLRESAVADLREIETYFEELADAEYFTDSAAPVGNEEMRLLATVQSAIAALLAQEGAAAPEGEGYYLASFKHRRDGVVTWWQANNAGYTPDLNQAGIYTELTPGYHDSDDTVPVPVGFIKQLRVRRMIDYGDSLNAAFHNAKSLRAILAAAGETTR